MIQNEKTYSMTEAMRFLRDCLNKRGQRTDEQVAASIVGLGTNESIDVLCEQDSDLSAIIAISWDLEWSNGSPQDLKLGWETIEKHLLSLERKYN